MASRDVNRDITAMTVSVKTQKAKMTPVDKLYKPGDPHEKLSNPFQNACSPSQNLSVDEQMVGARYCISFIKNMPRKPKKFSND